MADQEMVFGFGTKFQVWLQHYFGHDVHMAMFTEARWK